MKTAFNSHVFLVFGYKQSGGLSQIGFKLYSKMINGALEKKDLIKKTFLLDPEEISIKLFLNAAIPDEYIK